jgi:hypothetical protein
VSTLRRAYRWWHVRRTVVLSAALLAVGGLVGAQALKWKNDPAVYAVALLVTAQIGLVLSYLLWRHVRRQAPRESAVAAVLGVMAAVVLTVAAPVLARRASAPTSLSAVYVPRLPDAGPVEVAPAEFAGPERLAATTKPVPAVPPSPADPPPPERTAASARSDSEPPHATVAPPQDSAAESTERPELQQYRNLLQDPQWLRQRRQDDDEPRAIFRYGLPSVNDPAALPSMEATASLFLGHTRGTLGLGGGDVDDAPIGELLGEETFETAIELTADFPLAPRHVLRVSVVAMRSEESGVLERDLVIGGDVAPEGTPFEFSLQWAHAFIGFSHRFVGYTRESGFDFSMHVGVIVDHLSADLHTREASGSVLGDDLGWASPAVGVSIGLFDFHRSSLALEILQSVPVNIGGQAVAVTDVRVVIQHDLTETISVMIGYRRVLATYQSYEQVVGQGGSETHSRFDIGGPLVGLELRF